MDSACQAIGEPHHPRTELHFPTMAGRTSRRYSGLLVALYASSQAALGSACLWTVWIERDAHAIARCALHVLGCIALVLAGCYRGRRGGLCALGASLSYLVDGGVRFLAAATALGSRPGIRDGATLPPNAVRGQLILAVAVGAIPLPGNRRLLRAVTHAHAVVTALARVVDIANSGTPVAVSLAVPLAAELLSACCALFVAVACVVTCAKACLGVDYTVAAAQRKLAETTQVLESTIWRDETGIVRALVRLRARDAAVMRSRVQTALASMVDELHVQVDGLSTVSGGASPTATVT